MGINNTQKEFAVRIRNLSKFYEIGVNKDTKVLDALARIASDVIKPKKQNQRTGLWALKNISFELQKGDVLGIMGRNGSGKSTLLKVLSEITDPTSGDIEINGSIASILEIGMGFHPDLTGRDNVYQSSRILGFTKTEIREQLDNIISFSGLDNFADTPIKYYSNGMYIRLAFSIVTHVRAEILLLDEILSVGDAEFRIKCLSKIQELINEGRTVIFVSHNPSEIQSFCNKAMIMEEGMIKHTGNPVDIISLYNEGIFNLSQGGNIQIRNELEEVDVDKLETTTSPIELNEENFQEGDEANEDVQVKEEIIAEEPELAPVELQLTNEAELKPSLNYVFWDDPESTPFAENIQLRKLIARAKGKNYTEKIFYEDPIVIEIEFIKTEGDNNTMIALGIIDSSATTIFGSMPSQTIPGFSIENGILYSCSCEIPARFLNEGSYKAEPVIIGEGRKIHGFFKHAVLFYIHSQDKKQTDEFRLPGSITPPLVWTVVTPQ